MKTCTKCGETKTLDCFSKHNLTKDGVSTQCKVCRSAKYREQYKTLKKDDPRYAKGRKLRLNYKLSLADYDSLVKNQNGQCAICEDVSDNLFVDHCHTTGKVRGLLCHGCNTGIGLLKDSIYNLNKAIKYLT